MRVLLLWVACLATLGHCMAQEFKDRKTFSVDVSQVDRFHLYNRRGAVSVKATNGNTATLQVVRRLKASSSERLEEAKQEIYLDSAFRNGQLVFFIEHPDLKLKFDEDGLAHYHSKDEDGWNWGNNDKNRVEMEFTITLEIPGGTDLTVVNHEHPLEIDGMKADLIARNHHDGVLVKNQGGNADVHSHHGNVEVYYTRNPSRDCHYDTHHGDIRVHYQNGLKADASLYSYHGEFYTEFDWALSPMAVANETGGKGAKYRISGQSGTNVKIGAGGPLQAFKTHHGNIYLIK